MTETELIEIYAIMKKWEGKDSIFFTSDKLKLVEIEINKLKK